MWFCSLYQFFTHFVEYVSCYNSFYAFRRLCRFVPGISILRISVSMFLVITVFLRISVSMFFAITACLHISVSMSVCSLF